MAYLYEQLPYIGLSDEDLVGHLTDNSIESVNFNEIMSIDRLNSLSFDIRNCHEDSLFSNNEPDNFFSEYYSRISDSCKYYVDNFPKLKSNDFSIFFHNINSLAKHYDEISNLFDLEIKEKFNVISLCETKLNSDISHLYGLDGYVMFNKYNTRNKGGLTCYIDEKFQNCFIREDLSNISESTEFLFVEIPLSNSEKNILIGVIYRRPGTDFRQFSENLNNVLDILKLENKVCYLMGDFNLDLLKMHESAQVSELINLFTSENYLCTITNPTRVTNNTATLIDHIWCNNYQNLNQNGIIHNFITDHFPVLSVFGSDEGRVPESTECKNNLSYFRSFSEQNLNNFKHELNDVCWDLVVGINNIEVSYSNFESIFGALLNKHFPLISKKVKKGHENKPYITNNIKNLIKSKSEMSKLFAKYPITYGKSFRKLRNKITNEIRNSKFRHYNERLSMCSSDTGETWKVINSILKRQKEKTKSKEFIVDGEIVYKSRVIADSFNKHYSKVGTVM